MKSRLKNSILRFGTLLLIFTSCTDNFEEINTNPNAVDRTTNPALLLPKTIKDLADDNCENSFDRGAIVADQIANHFVGSFNDWTRLDAGRFSWNYYYHVKDIDYLIEISEEKGYDNYKAVAMILRAWLFQNITDNFGPVPYFESNKAPEEIFKPKFDSQEDIYTDLLLQLEDANNLLSASKEVVIGDILYNGNVENWKKFANGLQLRILLRQSDRKDPSVQMQKMMNDPATYPLFASHEEQAALQYLETETNANPLYRGNVSDWASSSSTRLAFTMDSILKSMNDPRIAAFALPTSASVDNDSVEYHGVPNGLNPGDAGNWNGGVLNQSLLGLLMAPKQYNPDLVSMNALQSVLMPYSEVQFILAEAVEKGYITGDAETYYLNGVKDQFAYYSSRIPSGWTLPTPQDLIPAPDYYAQETVAYTGTPEERLKKIYTQKWLSLFLVGFEAWSEWRRVGVPEIIPGPATSGFIPVRYVYPADEMRLNEENYNQAVEMLGGNGDEISTPVWWDID